MGCTNSKAGGGVESDMLEATRGGSMVTSAGSRFRRDSDEAAVGRKDDGSIEVEQSRGGSLLLGRKRGPEWEPGKPIVRPRNPDRTQHYAIDLEDGYILDIAYGYHSLQGANARPPHKPNQDSLLVSKSLGGTDLGLFAVFDGHGPKGEQASHFCRVHLADTITRHKSFKANPSAAYKAAFETIHERFTSPAVRRAGVDIDVSGSTAICALVDREEVRIANVGDSRAILGGVDADGRLVSKPLSTDHKPQRPDERDRIARSEAVIYSERYIIPEGDEHKLYVCREERGRIVYGVLFTRSIGDLDAHNHLGLTARPEVTRLNLDRTCDRFIVLATDGVWDQASEDDVGTLVNETEDPQDACDTIVDMARRRWDRRGNGRRDDITVMVMKLNWVPKDEWLATGEGRNRMDRRVVVEEDDEEDEVEFRRGGGAASSEHVHVDLED